MQEIILKARYFERGLSKSLKKGNFLSSFEPSPFLKFTSANLCKPIYDIINYSTSICPFDSGKCGKGKEYKNLNNSRTKRAF